LDLSVPTGSSPPYRKLPPSIKKSIRARKTAMRDPEHLLTDVQQASSKAGR
jgi:hypothetical protein